MALTASEQELVDWAKEALPAWFRDKPRDEEYLGLAAKTVGAAKSITEFWLSQSFILTAVGPIRDNDFSLRLRDGTNEFVKITDGAQTGLDISGDLTFEGWVQLDALGHSRTLVAKSDAIVTSDLSYIFGFEAADELVLLLSSDGTAGGIATGTSGVGAVTDAGWHHIAVTYDAATGETIFYVDATPFGAPVTTGPITIFNGAADFAIGNIGDGSLADFDGSVDEVRVWSVVRTPEEILASFQSVSPAPTTGLEGFWRFENNLNDSSVNGNTLTGQGGGPSLILGNLPFTNIQEPDWLDQHARDRGTRRQFGEADPALRDRLRNTPEALTRESLLDSINSILSAEGLADTANMVELTRDRAYFGVFTSDADATKYRVDQALRGNWSWGRN